MSAATYPVSTIAKLLLLNEGSVQRLARDGVLPKAERGGYELAPVVQAYVAHLRRTINEREGGGRYSLVQAATILGMHRNTLASWIDQGCPVVTRADRSRGIEWEISIPDVVAWDRERGIQAAVAGYAGDGERITKEEADRRRAVAQAITAEVGADEALRMVVARPEIEADMAAFCVALKTGLSNASARIAARAESMSAAPEIQDLCEQELNRAFDAAEGELAAKWLDGGDDERSGEGQPPPQG